MGADRLRGAFETGRKPTFVAYVTGGFPTREDTVPVMLAMQECGVGVIEVRSDPPWRAPSRRARVGASSRAARAPQYRPPSSPRAADWRAVQ